MTVLHALFQNEFDDLCHGFTGNFGLFSCKQAKISNGPPTRSNASQCRNMGLFTVLFPPVIARATPGTKKIIHRQFHSFAPPLYIQVVAFCVSDNRPKPRAIPVKL